MQLSEAERALMTQRLMQAEEAEHQLALGAQEVRLRSESGREVEYRPTNLRQLQGYIARLRAQLGLARRSGRSSRTVVF
ncbi:gpW family head-tail joining protein [Polycladidibacter hongkongensis]|uniref:gpW family head-tail joining protein n=1 Tax=Polycladidibacter hongkongensis TaxID=1647556 RepID=UPI000834C46D|nr:gpW family head-tail joining protein [Pseudovibrio hongkongensis]